MSYYLERFGGHRHCDSGDIVVLACNMISQGHVIKALRDFRGRSPLR